jgi:methyl-accepting chemotaxis protein
LFFLLSGCGLKVNFGTSNNNLSNNPTVITSVETTTIDMASKDMTNILDKLSAIEKDLANDNTKEAILEHLSNFKEKSGLNLASVFFGDELGNFYLVPTATLPDDYDARTRPWYITAKEKGEYANTYTDYVTNDKILTVAKAIYKDKNLIGVVSVDLIVVNNANTK